MDIRCPTEQESGMVADRATVVEALSLVESGEWDLVITEDLSRIFRNPRHQYTFVQDAVDAETRVICVGDGLVNKCGRKFLRVYRSDASCNHRA